MDTFYIDGEFVDSTQARVNASDIIVLRGFGIFDFLITYNRRPFYLKEHIQRLENSARNIGLSMAHTNEEIQAIVRESIDKNPHHTEANIRIVYSGGVSPDGVTPKGNGILMVMVTPKLILPAWWYTDGAGIITVDVERYIPTAKSTNYLSAVVALQKAHADNAVEAVYVDRDRRVLEGTTTNIFCFKGSTLITPPDGILPGITRSVVMKLAAGHFPLELRHIQFDELSGMDEVFLSASNKEIVPVVTINGKTVGNGKPGDRTRKVMKLFREYTTAYGKGTID
ncbi:MAG: aminotransferase class IV [Pseudomonadota bacterium]